MSESPAIASGLVRRPARAAAAPERVVSKGDPPTSQATRVSPKPPGRPARRDRTEETAPRTRRSRPGSGRTGRPASAGRPRCGVCCRCFPLSGSVETSIESSAGVGAEQPPRGGCIRRTLGYDPGSSYRRGLAIVRQGARPGCGTSSHRVTWPCAAGCDGPGGGRFRAASA